MVLKVPRGHKTVLSYSRKHWGLQGIPGRVMLPPICCALQSISQLNAKIQLHPPIICPAGMCVRTKNHFLLLNHTQSLSQPMELSGDFGDQQHLLVISCHAATGCVCGGDRLVPSPSPRAASVIVTNFPTPLGHFVQDFPHPGEDCDMPGTRVTVSNVAGQSQPWGGLAQGKQQLRVTFTEVEANLILLEQRDTPSPSQQRCWNSSLFAIFPGSCKNEL